VNKDLVNLEKQNEWQAKPDEELLIPESYIKDLHFEVVVFTRKERGGSDFTFRCKEYERVADGEYRFGGVILDTSKRNPKGEVELVRLTYHPELMLMNAAFMVMPAEESLDAD